MTVTRDRAHAFAATLTLLALLLSAGCGEHSPSSSADMRDIIEAITVAEGERVPTAGIRAPASELPPALRGELRLQDIAQLDDLHDEFWWRGNQWEQVVWKRVRIIRTAMYENGFTPRPNDSVPEALRPPKWFDRDWLVRLQTTLQAQEAELREQRRDLAVANGLRMFHKFVANRIAEIDRHAGGSSRGFINPKEDPAVPGLWEAIQDGIKAEKSLMARGDFGSSEAVRSRYYKQINDLMERTGLTMAEVFRRIGQAERR